jgi:hypothetical protein
MTLLFRPGTLPEASPPTPGGNSRRRHYRSSRRHFRDRERAATRRAVTAARLHLHGTIPVLSKAATACGSNTTYVAAAVILIKSENATLLNRVLAGHVPLLAAAREIKRLSDLVAAYRKTTANERVAFARTVGPTDLFEGAVVPAL